MKQNTRLLILVALALLLGTGLYLSQPRPIADQRERLELFHISYFDENGVRTDLTGRVDMEALADVIVGHTRSRIPRSFAPYQQTSLYEIDGIYRQKPFHMILGRISYVYESGDRGGYPILDSAGLLAEVEALVGR